MAKNLFSRYREFRVKSSNATSVLLICYAARTANKLSQIKKNDSNIQKKGPYSNFCTSPVLPIELLRLYKFRFSNLNRSLYRINGFAKANISREYFLSFSIYKNVSFFYYILEKLSRRKYETHRKLFIF